MINRDEAVNLLHEFTDSESLRKHAPALQAAHEQQGQTLDGERLGCYAFQGGAQ